ncbi:hypothetical protein ACFV1H_15505 [Streptomyces virginiae]|uniref:hypothetical protein n=1 Tax=Streptomyces virginiae TaxID=1961 RepID=UPI0036BC4C8E
MFADQAIALSNTPSLGLLNAVFGKAHTAALRGDRTTASRLLVEGRRVFDRAGSLERCSTEGGGGRDMAGPRPGGKGVGVQHRGVRSNV